MLNPFQVSEVGFSMLHVGHAHCCKKGFQTQIKNRMANSVDPDETAHFEPSHLDLHCLHRHLFWSVRLTGLVKMIYPAGGGI